MSRLWTLVPLLCLALTAMTAPAALGEAVRLPVTRDTWFSNVGAEAEANLGGASRLKLKSIQEMSLVDVDPSPLRGRVVRSATLHLRSTGEPRLLRVTVGSFGADWVEGTSASYAPQAGSSSHNHRKNPDVPWTVPGSDLCGVILGQGGTIWRMADASAPDPRGWQALPVDPAVVAARVAGISTGFFLFDDTGTEWTRHGEAFSLKLFPNRFVHSRESGPASAPYLTVELGADDRMPPEAPGDLGSEADELPAGESWISWTSPGDVGPAGTAGFFVSAGGKDLPRHLVPPAKRPGERVRMHLRDLDLAAGAEVPVSVRAVDGAGNVGAAAEARVRVSAKVPAPLPPEAPALLGSAARAARPLLDVGGDAGGKDLPSAKTVPADLEFAIIDELEKVHPDTGERIPGSGSLFENHLWSARAKTLRLHAARNEFVAFQVLLGGKMKGAEASLAFERGAAPGIQVEFGRYQHVATARGPLPDPIVPSSLRLDDAVAGRKTSSLLGEVYVSHEAAAGEHKGTLTLKSEGRTRTLDVVLRVWDFTLPDHLSFLPEMNCYDLPANERDYYRLAHRHRTVLNKVPYSHNGSVQSGCAPGWDGKRLAWPAWDRRFGPLFDGSAFADLPRHGVPLECFYLPLFENWPDPMEGNYDGGYWADRAFPAAYREDFIEVSRQFAEHFHARGWNDTFFQCYFNGKNNFKERGWSRGTSPWLLDEPASFQDFWALRYFGSAFHEGVRRSPGTARMVFRCDVSRPQWQRDSLDGLLDYNVVSGAMRPYHRIVFDRKEAQGQVVVEYGGSNAIEDANVQPLGWCLDAWCVGCDGVLPWQTLGTAGSWTKADSLALFYPGPGPKDPPIPSIRLKAYRRGQQDVEYLTLLGLVTKEPRWAIGRRVLEALHLAPERRGTGFTGGEDAGLLTYDRLDPAAEWALRVRVGAALSALRPAPKRRLEALRTPPRDPSRLAPGYVSGAEPAAGRGLPRDR